MKRMIACLLALLLLLSAAAAEDHTEGNAADRLLVGNPTPMRGEFFTDMWGNATSDIDVRDLLHGYNLVLWNGDFGAFMTDPTVVSRISSQNDTAGNRIYTLYLNHDLVYSDGTPITARDYAFSWLFSLSAEAAEIGAVPRRVDQFLGYDKYMSGEVPYLSGVRLTGEFGLKITIRKEYVPFFHELGLLLCNPYPISVIAPGVVVKDDGQGVYLANEDGSTETPIYTADLLRETVLDPDTGYMSHPSVVSGPYTLTSWDGETAEFAINPYYKGNSKGERPTIPVLVYTVSDNETQIEDLKAGTFDLLNKVTRKDGIAKGIELAGAENYSAEDYPRSGLCFISFACEKDTVASVAVRQAIAWCLDRDQLRKEYTGLYGVTVDGYYGIGQYMYRLVAGEADPPVKDPGTNATQQAKSYYKKRVEAFKALNLDGLTHYTVDTEKAVQLLEADGWRLNADGLREKDGVVLDLKMICPEGNNITEYLEENFLINLDAVGIRLTVEVMPMNQLLSHWYQQEERTEDMIYMATNFYLLFDPCGYFDKDGCWAYTCLKDNALYQAAKDMSKTKPGDALTYMKNWITFQERFNEILPMIPIYSNYYYDFFTDDLINYQIDENITWGQAIVSAELER